MKCYVKIEDCQNNVQALVVVDAETRQEAKYKALRALHHGDNLYIVDEEEAKSTVEEGVIPICEYGYEVEL